MRTISRSPRYPPRGATPRRGLIGNLAAQAITAGSPTFEAGREVIGVSASLEQSRVMLSFARAALKDREHEYRWLDSGQRLAVTHQASGAKFRILSSSGKRAMGLENFSTIYADEPARGKSRNGSTMWDAIRTSLGKRPGQRLLLIGTRAPAEAGSWWPELLEAGSGPGVHVEVLAAPDDAPGTPGRRSADATRWPASIPSCERFSCSNAIRHAATRRWRHPSRRTGSTGLSVSPNLYCCRSWTGGRYWSASHLSAKVNPFSGSISEASVLGVEPSLCGRTGAWNVSRCCPASPDIEERERMDAVPPEAISGSLMTA